MGANARGVGMDRDGLIKLQHEIFSSSSGVIQGEPGAVCRGDGSPFHCDLCEQ